MIFAAGSLPAEPPQLSEQSLCRPRSFAAAQLCFRPRFDSDRPCSTRSMQRHFRGCERCFGESERCAGSSPHRSGSSSKKRRASNLSTAMHSCGEAVSILTPRGRLISMPSMIQVPSRHSVLPRFRPRWHLRSGAGLDFPVDQSGPYFAAFRRRVLPLFQMSKADPFLNVL